MHEPSSLIREAREHVQPRWDRSRMEASRQAIHQRRARRQRRARAALVALALTACVGLGWWAQRAAAPSAGRAPAPAAQVAREGGAVRFTDGSVATPLGDAELRVAVATAALTRVQLGQGRARFEVTPGTPRRFVVEAGAVEVVVLGTVFEVERRGAAVEVAVQRGRVRVCAADQRWELDAGEATRLELRLDAALDGAGSEGCLQGVARALAAGAVAEAAAPEGTPDLAPGGAAPGASGGVAGATPERAVPGGRERATPGGRERATPGGRERATPGGRERATSGGRERATSGGRERATSGGRERVERAAPAAHATPRASAGAGSGEAPDWRALAERGAFPEAARALTPLLATLDDPESLMLAADVMRVQGRDAEAITLLERLLRDHAGDRRAGQARFLLGRLLLSGRPCAAARVFGGLDAERDRATLVEDGLAREVEAWRRCGDVGRARARARRYLERYPDGLHRDAVIPALAE